VQALVRGSIYIVSKKLLPVFEEAAKELFEVNGNIKFMKMDATENEVPELMIRSYPTMKFFKKGKEIIDVVDFKEEKTVEGILKFLKANSSHSWVEVGKKKRDDL
jgi:protein disulfide-isomerase A1